MCSKQPPMLHWRKREARKRGNAVYYKVWIMLFRALLFFFYHPFVDQDKNQNDKELSSSASIFCLVEP